jgi:hypothetical protein
MTCRATNVPDKTWPFSKSIGLEGFDSITDSTGIGQLGGSCHPRLPPSLQSIAMGQHELSIGHVRDAPSVESTKINCKADLFFDRVDSLVVVGLG